MHFSIEPRVDLRINWGCDQERSTPAATLASRTTTSIHGNAHSAPLRNGRPSLGTHVGQVSACPRPGFILVSNRGHGVAERFHGVIAAIREVSDSNVDAHHLTRIFRDKDKDASR